MRFNRDLFDRTISRIARMRYNPGWEEDFSMESTWNQGVWMSLLCPECRYPLSYCNCENPSSPNSCGTTACFAGWAVIEAGFSVGFDHNLDEYFINYDGMEMTIPDAAMTVLGLTIYQANKLFYSENSLQNLINIAREF